MQSPTRRIVTGHTEEAAPLVLTDDLVAGRLSTSSGAKSTVIWTTNATPASIETGTNIPDAALTHIGTAPPSGGTRFVVVEFPPGFVGEQHRTETIDYVVVISGSIDLRMDGKSTLLSAGDCMVQRGTNHSWVNSGEAPSRVAFVLIDAIPLNLGSPLLGSAQAK